MLPGLPLGFQHASSGFLCLGLSTTTNPSGLNTRAPKCTLDQVIRFRSIIVIVIKPEKQSHGLNRGCIRICSWRHPRALVDAKEGGPLIWPSKSQDSISLPYEATTGHGDMHMVIKDVFAGVGIIRLAMYKHYASMLTDDGPDADLARFGSPIAHLRDPSCHSHIAMHMTAPNRKPNKKYSVNQRASK